MNVIENLTARVERLEEIVAKQTKLLKFFVEDYNNTTDALQRILDNLQAVNDGDS